jgi:hypothetical protein
MKVFAIVDYDQECILKIFDSKEKADKYMEPFKKKMLEDKKKHIEKYGNSLPYYDFLYDVEELDLE